MKPNKLASILALSLGLGAMAAPAYANKLFYFEDDDLEWVLRPDNAGGYTEVTSGSLQVGDVLIAVFEMPTFEINGVNAIPAGMELTGISAIQVASITNNGSSFVFQPWAGLNANYLGGSYTGATIAMWMNDLSPNLDLVGANPSQLSCTTLATCAAQAGEGTLFQVDGFAGDPDEYWTAIALETDLANIKAAGQTDQQVIFKFGLSNLFSASGPVGYIKITGDAYCGPVDQPECVQFKGSGSLYGAFGLETTGIVGVSDFQARKYVPEPGTLALLGMGLLGLGATARRRKA